MHKAKGGVKKYYAVKRGRKVGVFETWDECQRNVKGFSGAEFKSFQTYGEAQSFAYDGGAGGQQLAGPGVAPPQHRNEPLPPPQPVYPGPPRAQRANEVSGSSQRGDTTSFDPILRKVRATAKDAALSYSGPPIRKHWPYFMYFDGASRGNPGRAGSGAVIIEARFNTNNSLSADGTEIAQLVQPLPYGSTNNEAEYSGLILGLQGALNLGIDCLNVRGDSQLVCKQVNGEWRVSKPHLMPFCEEAKSLMASFEKAELEYVPREMNGVADYLSNQAVDMSY